MRYTNQKHELVLPIFTIFGLQFIELEDYTDHATFHASSRSHNHEPISDFPLAYMQEKEKKKKKRTH